MIDCCIFIFKDFALKFLHFCKHKFLLIKKLILL